MSTPGNKIFPPLFYYIIKCIKICKVVYNESGIYLIQIPDCKMQETNVSQLVRNGALPKRLPGRWYAPKMVCTGTIVVALVKHGGFSCLRVDPMNTDSDPFLQKRMPFTGAIHHVKTGIIFNTVDNGHKVSLQFLLLVILRLLAYTKYFSTNTSFQI